MQGLNVLLVLVTLSFLWGSSFLAIKLVIHVVPPILAFGIRFAIAGAALLIAHIVNERRQHIKKNEHIGKHQWKDAVIVAILIVVGGTRIVGLGYAVYISAGMTALLNCTIPFWIAIIAAMLFKIHLTKRMILGLRAGFLGLLTLLNPFSGGSANNSVNMIGVLFLKVLFAGLLVPFTPLKLICQLAY
jgi:drug/metabolite transporter (DMT)-like permease